MAETSLANLANSVLVLAYGRHAVRGFVQQWKTSTVGSDTLTQAMIDLGEGEWLKPEAVYYGGALIDPSKYTFHPGRLSFGANDPVQGIDTRLGATDLSNGDTNNKTAYITLDLPLNVSPNSEPTEFVGIFKTKIVPNFDSSGNYDPSKPINVVGTATSGGSLTASTYYIRIVAISLDTNDISFASDEINVSVDGSSTTAISLNWVNIGSPVSGYRIFVSTSPAQQAVYFSSSTNSFTVTTMSGGTVDTISSYQGGYSSNNARILADLFINIKKFDISRINWLSWLSLRQDCDQQIEWDDGITVLSTMAAASLSSGSGSLPAATYYIKMTALAGTCETEASPESNITVASSSSITVSFTLLPNCSRYRVYIGTATNDENKYIEFTNPGNSVVILDLLSAVSATPPVSTSGTGRSLKRYECNRAFTSPTDVEDCIDLVLSDCGADVQISNGMVTFLTSPRNNNPRVPVFNFNQSNILSITPKRPDKRTKPDVFNIVFRDLDDQYLTVFPGYQIFIDEDINVALSSRRSHLVLNDNFGNMNQSQVRRIGKGKMRLAHDLDINIDTLKSTGDAFIVLPGDIVTVTWPPLNLDNKKFLVIEARDSSPTETADEREFVLQQYPDDDGLYSDSDQIKSQPITYVGGAI